MQFLAAVYSLALIQFAWAGASTATGREQTRTRWSVASAGEAKLLEIAQLQPWRNYTRLLLIGDSVDRYLVIDWCSAGAAAGQCKLFTEASREATNASSPATVWDLMKVHGRRRKAYEIRVCECWQKRVMVTYVANKFGVKANGPWHSPIATMAGAETELAASSNKTLLETFSIGLFPVFAALEKAAGGPPHGIMFSSVFWDLSHPDPEGIREKQPNLWLKGWETNVSLAMQLIQTYYPSDFNMTNYGRLHSCKRHYMWRTANHFRIVPPTSHPFWATSHADLLRKEMNNRSAALCEERGFAWIDFTKQRIRLRDSLHPDSSSLLPLAENVTLTLQHHASAC